MRYNVCTNREPTYDYCDPCPRLTPKRLERVVSQLDRAAPLKVRACKGTSEGSSTEVLKLGHALCRSNSSSKNSALAATPQIRGNLALGLQSAGVARRRRARQI